MIDFQPTRSRTQAGSLVEQLVGAVIAAIEAQVLQPGMPVLSVRAFALHYEISTFTVASAYARLVSQGWLTARRGAGYRVASRLGPEFAAPAPAWEPPSLNAAWLSSDIFADHSIPIKAGCGWLPGDWRNEDGLHRALRQVGRAPVARLAGYGHPYGYAPLRATIAGRLLDLGMRVEPDQVLLTQGVTHGLDLAIRTLLRPGETVVVESPCYANLLSLLRLTGLRVIAVPRTPDGLDCHALEQIVQRHRPRALFVNTVLQNPSATSLSMSNAFQVLQLIQRHALWLIEDDISRELLPGLAPVLAALDGAQRVVYLGGYSKVISPSVRVGYMVAHRDVIRDMARTKMLVGLTSPEIMERVVPQVIREGGYRAHIERTQERLAQAHAELGGTMATHGLTVYSQPGAGLFLWGQAGDAWRQRGSKALAELALKDGIWLAPGAYFDADETDGAWLRFNVAYSNHEALWRFLRGAHAAS